MTAYSVAQLDAMDATAHYELAGLDEATLSLPRQQRNLMIAAYRKWAEEEGLDADLFEEASDYNDFDLYSELRINEVPFPRAVMYTLEQFDAMSEDEHWELSRGTFAVLLVSDEQRREMVEIRDEFLDDLASEGIVDQDPLSQDMSSTAIYHELRINDIDFERLDIGAFRELSQ